MPKDMNDLSKNKENFTNDLAKMKGGSPIKVKNSPIKARVSPTKAKTLHHEVI